MKKIIYILGIFFVATIVWVQTSEAFFSRNLSVGSVGQDVLELQKVLNQKVETRLATDGVGSPGNETTYFGELTKNAVIRYQNLFSQEILVPVGLSSGTGYVGPSTRAHLNSVSQSTQPAQIIPTTTTSPSTPSTNTSLNTNSFASSLANSKELYLFYPSLYEGEAGKKLTLYGAGFEDKNDVHFGSKIFSDISSQNDGTSITITAPDLPSGYYGLSVENSKGKTNTDAFFIIKSGSTKNPVIENLNPQTGGYGETVTLSGTGFTGDNQIRTTYGIINNIDSNNGKMSFTIEPFPDNFGSDGLQHIPDDFSWDIGITVVNSNGISNTKIYKLEL